MNAQSSPAVSGGLASGVAMALSPQTRTAFGALGVVAVGLAVLLPALAIGY